jgi:hypothetical protein
MPVYAVIGLLGTVIGILLSVLLTLLIQRVSGLCENIRELCEEIEKKADKSTTDKLWDRIHHHKHNGDGRVVIMEGS